MSEKADTSELLELERLGGTDLLRAIARKAYCTYEVRNAFSTAGDQLCKEALDCYEDSFALPEARTDVQAIKLAYAKQEKADAAAHDVLEDGRHKNPEFQFALVPNYLKSLWRITCIGNEHLCEKRVPLLRYSPDWTQDHHLWPSNMDDWYQGKDWEDMD